MTLDISRCRLPPFKHQAEDTETMVRLPYFFITSEMRTGKTKIVIDAAQYLFEAQEINRVIVVTPAPVRDVWADRELGELSKHLWADIHATVTEYHANIRTWVHGAPSARSLDFYVSNFEFLRSKNRLIQLLPICGPKTLLVLDESSFVKNWAAQQTKACVQLRNRCGRVVLLNGTPLFHSPLDLFSQGNLLHATILDCKFITRYKARYAIQEPILGHGGKALTSPHGDPLQKIAGWTNLEDLQRRFAPYTVRRLQAECLDLPPKLDPVTLTASLNESWPAYKAMRDDLVVWLTSGKVASAATAATKVMRLAQITSGFVGGVEASAIEPLEPGFLESLLLDEDDHGHRGLQTGAEGVSVPRNTTGGDFSGNQNAQRDAQPDTLVVDAVAEWYGSPHTQEVGREKLDVLLWFLERLFEQETTPKVVAWCRHRYELFRTVRVVAERFPQFTMGSIQGSQKKTDRLATLRLLKPETSPNTPIFVAGVIGTGSFGLDMAASHTCITMSHVYSPGRTGQTMDRVYGPGQTHPIAYYDIVAVGPKGQKTIDHIILAARRNGENLAAWTAQAWVKKLKE